VAVTFSIETSTRAAGAIAIIRLGGADLDAALTRLGLPTVPPGSVVLTDLLGVDMGLLARYTPTAADLMVHGGRGVVAAMTEALLTHGIKEGASGTSPLLGGSPVPLTSPLVSAPGLAKTLTGRPVRGTGAADTPSSPPPPPAGEERSHAWPEAADAIEAAMLETLAHAASPRAIPLLLAQPSRHRLAPAVPFADGSALAHLLSPPLVVITGPPNIGKSSLLNALLGREAAIVANEPGTTRDAVAAHAVLDGLAVRLLDTPGLAERAAGSRPPSGGRYPPLDKGSPAEPDELVRAATAIAEGLIAAADLVLVCRDAATASEPIADPLPAKGGSLPAALAVSTRIDLAPATPPTALAVSAKTGQGLPALAVAIREALVPDAALDDPRPWPFAAAHG